MRRFLLLLCFVVSSVVYGADTKNIIWVIGDGMGPEIMGFFMEGVRYGGLSQYPEKTSPLEQLLNQSTWGFFFNNTYDTIVTDSAAAATQMATGAFSRTGFIGMDYNKNPQKTLLELAREKGLSIGVISDAYVTDATPAAFVAHTLSRRQKYKIARQMIEFGPDVILGGGLNYFNSKENADLLKTAQAKGYRLALNSLELDQIEEGKILGLFAPQALPLAVDFHKHPQIPSLLSQTQKALKILSGNKNGFILMVEVGKIDWAAHANDAGALFQEMQIIDGLLGYLKSYTEQTEGTLLYVNADHDTGLGSFTYRQGGLKENVKLTSAGEALYEGNTNYALFSVYHQFMSQTESFSALEEEINKIPVKKRTPEKMRKKISQVLGYEADMSVFTDITNPKQILNDLNKSRGIVFATHGHSSLPILSIAYGEGKEVFGGVYHNTDILPRMKQVLGWTQ